MTSAKYARALASRVEEAHTQWGRAKIFDHDPELRDRFISQMSFALQEKVVLYVTVENDEEASTIDALAFTETSVVWTNYEKANDQIETWVMNRDQIEEIVLTGAPNYLSGSSNEDALVKARIVIAGMNFKLPGDEQASSANFAELATFLSKLLP